MDEFAIDLNFQPTRHFFGNDPFHRNVLQPRLSDFSLNRPILGLIASSTTVGDLDEDILLGVRRHWGLLGKRF